MNKKRLATGAAVALLVCAALPPFVYGQDEVDLRAASMAFDPTGDVHVATDVDITGTIENNGLCYIVLADANESSGDLISYDFSTSSVVTDYKIQLRMRSSSNGNEVEVYVWVDSFSIPISLSSSSDTWDVKETTISGILAATDHTLYIRFVTTNFNADVEIDKVWVKDTNNNDLHYDQAEDYDLGGSTVDAIHPYSVGVEFRVGSSAGTLIDTGEATDASNETEAGPTTYLSEGGSDDVVAVWSAQPAGYHDIYVVVPDYPYADEEDYANNDTSGTKDVWADLTIETTSGGTTDPAPGVHSPYYGESESVTAQRETGYYLNRWELDGGNVGRDNPYSVEMDDDHTLKAFFTRDLLADCQLYNDGDECLFDATGFDSCEVVFSGDSDNCMNSVLDQEQSADDWVRLAHWNYNNDTPVRVFEVTGGTGRYRVVSNANKSFRVYVYGIIAPSSEGVLASSSDLKGADPLQTSSAVDTDPFDFPAYSLGSRNLDAAEFGVLTGPTATLTVSDAFELEDIPRYLGGASYPNTFTVTCPFVGWGDPSFNDVVKVKFNTCQIQEFIDDAITVNITATGVEFPGPHQIIIPEGELDYQRYTADLGLVTLTPPGSMTVTLSVAGGVFELDGLWISTNPSATAVKKDETPPVFGLAQNYPNPFRTTTEIRFDLPSDCFVTLEVYNVAGQRVATLVNESMSAGTKIAHWNASDSRGERVSSGIYFYRLQAGDLVEIRKMVVTR